MAIQHRRKSLISLALVASCCLLAVLCITSTIASRPSPSFLTDSSRHGATHNASEKLSLQQLLQNSGTDKLWRHGYHRYYSEIFAAFRIKKDVRILEIGVEHGRSLVTWAKFFENAAPDGIQGVSFRHDGDFLRSSCEVEKFALCEKVRVFYGDQSNSTFLDELVRDGALIDPESHLCDVDWQKCGWDIVIDDGSHLPRHQLISFYKLFPFVRPGGVYVIEDIETSYFDANFAEIYGYKIKNAGIGKPAPGNFVEKMKQLIDVVNRHWFYRPEYSVLGPKIDHNIRSISFGGGLIWVQKHFDSDKGYPTKLGFTRNHATDGSIAAHLDKISREDVFLDKSKPPGK